MYEQMIGISSHSRKHSRIHAKSLDVLYTKPVDKFRYPSAWSELCCTKLTQEQEIY